MVQAIILGERVTMIECRFPIVSTLLYDASSVDARESFD